MSKRKTRDNRVGTGVVSNCCFGEVFDVSEDYGPDPDPPYDNMWRHTGYKCGTCGGNCKCTTVQQALALLRNQLRLMR